LAHPLQWLSLH